MRRSKTHESILYPIIFIPSLGERSMEPRVSLLASRLKSIFGASEKSTGWAERRLTHCVHRRLDLAGGHDLDELVRVEVNYTDVAERASA